MTLLRKAALAYAKRGWPIFPCRSDKTPYTIHGVLDATTNIDQIEDWWDKWPKANVALDVAGAGMMVIDLDPGHSMEELEDNVGPIPKTRLRASTPRGGSHLFLSIDDGEIVSPSASKLAAQVDIRSFNSYVLLAPSKTADGNYTWEEEGKPAFRTDELLRACNTGREKHKDRDEWVIKPDLPENVALASEWLKDSAKIATKGQGGDNMTYATAAHMKSFGMSEAMAFDLMWEHWCPRCSPPWPNDMVDNLEQKIVNAYSYNTSPPGNITPAYTVARHAALFKPIVKKQGKKGHEWTSGRFRIVDRSAMGEIKPPSWLIEDFLPDNSYTIMFGAPGTFKTFIALDIALSIATGFGMGDECVWPDIVTSGPVLYAAGEGRANINSRITAWEKTHFLGVEVSGFHLADPVPMITEEIEPFLDIALDASPKGYRLVVLDTVGRAMQGTNENAQENASAFTHMVEVIQKELSCSVLCLHHTGLKEGDRARGSSVFGADADTMLRLERQDKEYTVALTMTKQKDAQEWSKPKFIKLTEISISEDNETLVAMKATKQDLPKKPEKNKIDTTVLDVIEDVLLDILENNKLEKHTQTALSDAIACDNRIDVASQQLRKTHLRSIRENNNRAAAKCYDPVTKKWRYQD